MVDAEPAAVVLGGVTVTEEAYLGAYPFAGAGSETVGLVRKRSPFLSIEAVLKAASSQSGHGSMNPLAFSTHTGSSHAPEGSVVLTMNMPLSGSPQ